MHRCRSPVRGEKRVVASRISTALRSTLHDCSGVENLLAVGQPVLVTRTRKATRPSRLAHTLSHQRQRCLAFFMGANSGALGHPLPETAHHQCRKGLPRSACDLSLQSWVREKQVWAAAHTAQILPSPIKAGCVHSTCLKAPVLQHSALLFVLSPGLEA